MRKRGITAGWKSALLRYEEGVHDLGQPATAEALESASRRCGFALPPSFRDFLTAHDGGTFFHEAYGIRACAELLPDTIGWEGDATLYLDAKRAGKDGELPVVRFEPGAGQRFTVGSRFDRWLDAALARESLVYGPDGEFRDVFDAATAELRPDIMRKREERALQADPDAPATHYELGRLHAHAGRPRRAMEHLERAVDLEPEFAWAHFELGRLQREARRGPQAVDSFLRAAELDPEQAPVSYAWAARVSAEHGDREGAGRLRARVRLRDPAFAQRHKEVGRSLLKQGDPNAADMLGLAWAIDPADAESERLLARAVAGSKGRGPGSARRGKRREP